MKYSGKCFAEDQLNDPACTSHIEYYKRMIITTDIFLGVFLMQLIYIYIYFKGTTFLY